MTYTDSMSDMDMNTIKTYQNFQHVSQVSTYPGATLGAIPGRNAFTFANSAQPVGYAQYRISGAQTVTVDLYTQFGAFAAYVAEYDAYAYGAFTNDKGLLGAAPLIQCLYSKDNGGVYARINGLLCSPVDNGLYKEFRAAGAPGGLVDYGVNVYAGESPGALTRLSCSTSSQQRLATMEIGGSYVYEQLQYQLPSSAKYVRVEINDYLFLEKQQPNGEIARLPPATGMRTALSRVTFEGGNLVLGEPESLQSEYTPPRESSGAEEKSSSSKSSSKAQPGASSGAGGSSYSAKSSQGKFEGEILADPPASSSSKKAGGGGAEDREGSNGPSSSGEEAADSMEERSRTEVFRLEPSGGGAMSGAILLYMGVVAALIVLLVLRGKK